MHVGLTFFPTREQGKGGAAWCKLNRSNEVKRRVWTCGIGVVGEITDRERYRSFCACGRNWELSQLGPGKTGLRPNPFFDPYYQMIGLEKGEGGEKDDLKGV